MACLAAACAAAGWRLGLAVPEPAFLLLGRADQTPNWVVRARRNDPKIGTVIHLPPLPQVSGQKAVLQEPGRPACLLFLWDCGGCSLDRRVRMLQEHSRRKPGLLLTVVAVGADAGGVGEFWRREGLTPRVALDPNASLARRMNAMVSGRVYLLDSERRLRYVSPIDASMEDLERDLHRALGNRSLR